MENVDYYYYNHFKYSEMLKKGMWYLEATIYKFIRYFLTKMSNHKFEFNYIIYLNNKMYRFKYHTMCISTFDEELRIVIQYYL